ncbi:MAG TPA: SDR family NAD(P)-dependent oxidoreductase [Candidatus Nanopelagicales bacterium]|nr:SDR family NAD(P)-dependent oxidoreductase [Candidatus Nanopelagicales bacterium]
MANELRFDGKVAIVTGAGGGLGRAHALLLASRGARVIVNDLGGGMHGGGKSSAAADRVVEEIKAQGGEAAANHDSVEDGAKIVEAALDHFGRIDIVINNAGILRDVTFHKMTEDDWDLIYRVHVLGGFRVTHAAWPHLRDQGYGRILMTASAAGIYGNFGQANYAMAKLGLTGFANTLALEGKKRNVLVNTIAPIAGSRLTETVLPKEITDALKPEYVSPLVAYLAHESCTETGGLFEVGGGFFAKLRWERAGGAMLRLGRPFTPEQIAARWSEIAGFEKATHPGSVAESMGPVMTNIEAGPSKGGNEYIDVDLALGYEYPSLEGRYDERDLALYALGVGAAADPLDDKELRFVYEMHKDGLLALPTFGVIPAMGALVEQYKQGVKAPGLNYGFDRLLHGEQYTELKRPLPPHAKLTHRIRVKDIFDKGKNAVVVTEVRSFDESGEELIYNEYTSVIRGAGGWGGDRGPSTDANAPPDRAPDATLSEPISPNQALLYRLSGDVNPLHADPSFATMFGFPKPILHGLCTFGYAGRHALRAFGVDPRLFKSIKVRFAESVFPGETLITEMWKESDTRILLRCKVKERDKVVLSSAAIELYTEIPKPRAKPAAAAAATATGAATVPAAAQGGGSEDVFIAIRDHIEKNPGLVAKTATLFQFKLTNPDSTWTLDLKNGNGAVVQGATDQAPECTLELTESDFIGMATGKLDAMKLYTGGQLKISGNLMASQKLNFLKKIDPAQAREAVAAYRAKHGGGSAPAAAPPAAAPAAPAAPAAAPSSGPSVQELLSRLAEVAQKALPEPLGIVQLRLTAPDLAWVLDAAEGKAEIRPGEAKDAAVTVQMSGNDLAALLLGDADLQRLFQRGKLRVDGDVNIAKRLGTLKGILAEDAGKQS